MVPKYRCWFKNSGIQDAHMVEWDKLKEFVGLGRLFDDSKKSTLFTLMQSTGLKDKNGVEIFEGDVVSVSVQNGFDYLDNKVCIVKNSIGHSGLVCATVDEDLEYRIFNTELFEEYTYEVIGNIYENSELLEEQR
ncbi:YopX family protein [Enterococcus durans]|uniref:YopX family protein n=1 Tax=Enterococcus durans TaxID=53345 RepID=UPI0039A5C4A2